MFNATFADETLNLTISTNNTIRSNVLYEFAFEIQNPSSSQGAASISVESSALKFNREPIRGQRLFVAREPLPGSHREVVGVINGSDPMKTVIPTFTLHTIAQSHPFAGYYNTFTCRLQVNVDLAYQGRQYLIHQYPGRSIVRVSGFTDAQGAESVLLTSTPGGNAGNKLFSDNSGNISSGTYEDGTLVLYLQRNQTMRAHEAYEFEFQLVNPGYEQHQERIVSVQATGSANMSKLQLNPPSRPLFGIANGTNPLVLVQPVFKVSTIQQSTPVTALINTITIVLQSSFDLAHSHDAAITIIGLLNAVTSAPSLILGGNGSLLFSDDANTGSLLYVNNTISLRVGQGKNMLKGESYVISFDVTNPNFDQAEGTLLVQASCQSERFALDGSEILIPVQAMQTTNEAILGVANGSNPLLVVIPTFKRSLIAQSDPLVGKTNVISVLLVSNVNLAASEQSQIEISGLDNATLDAVVTLLPSENGNAGHLIFAEADVLATALFETGTLTLTVAPGKTLHAETFYKFDFVVTNPAREQDRPDISIKASGSALFAVEPLSGPNLPVVGVINGSDVMLIENPRFVLFQMAQSTPLAFYNNIYTVTLQTNVDLAHADASWIELTGLHDAVGPESVELGTSPSGNAGNQLFSDGILANGSTVSQTASFLNGTVKLYLAANQTMLAHVPYIFTFMLTNPDSRLDPSVSHASRIDSPDGFVPPAIVLAQARGTATILQHRMVYPNQPLMSVPNGTNPLVLLLEPLWYDAQISQSNALADEENNITIRFETNIDLRGSEEPVITGTGSHCTRPKLGCSCCTRNSGVCCLSY